jgi:hypothetical protein
MPGFATPTNSVGVNADRQDRHKPGKAQRYRSIREKAAARGLK